MKNYFVTYDIARTLKEKGFNEPCIVHYFIDTLDELHPMGGEKEVILKPLVTSDGILSGIEPNRIEFNLCAPLWQQCVDWLEKKYNFFFERLMNEEKGVYYILWRNGNSIYFELKTLDEAILKALELISNK